MSALILDPFGVTEYKGVPVVSSRFAADVFKKRHDSVLRSIEDIIGGLHKIAVSGETMSPLITLQDVSPESYFIKSRYKNNQNKWQPEILLTRKGFDLTVMGFTGNEALQYKIAYIKRFDEMENFIKSLTAAKLEFPEFTNAIMAAHDEPKHYHYSNESDMINRIVLGMPTKKFREMNGIQSGQSIRPHLTPQQISAIGKLQKFDIGLIYTEPDFQKRKAILTGYYERLQSVRLIGMAV